MQLQITHFLKEWQDNPTEERAIKVLGDNWGGKDREAEYDAKHKITVALISAIRDSNLRTFKGTLKKSLDDLIE